MRPPDLTASRAKDAPDATALPTRRRTSGRFFIFHAHRGAVQAQRVLERAGLRTYRPTRAEALTLREDDLGDVDVVFHPALRCALLSGEGDQPARVRELMGSRSPLVALRPELVHRVAPLLHEEVEDALVAGPLDRTGVTSSKYNGSGVRVAVIDTGIDLEHPDLRQDGLVGSRSVSFVSNDPSVRDVTGHGTHVAGIVAGAVRPAGVARYAVAPAAELFVARVVTPAGDTVDNWILSALQWALLQRCKVACLAISRPIAPGEVYDMAFEAFVQNGLAAHMLLVAAVGNDSRRSLGSFRPVAHPANCPSILSVSAIGPQDVVFDQANRNGEYHGAGEVDLVAPGVKIQSARPEPSRYGTLSGTSQAAAHAAGAAALVAQAFPGLSAYQIGMALKEHALPITGLSALDAGAGCIRVPQ